MKMQTDLSDANLFICKPINVNVYFANLSMVPTSQDANLTSADLRMVPT